MTEKIAGDSKFSRNFLFSSFLFWDSMYNGGMKTFQGGN